MIGTESVAAKRSQGALLSTPSNNQYAPPRSDGSRATLARIFWLRNVVNDAIRFVPVLGPLYGLVDVLMIFGGQRRCCHDYIADTIVIRA